MFGMVTYVASLNFNSAEGIVPAVLQSWLRHKSGKKKERVQGSASYEKVEQCKSNGRNQTKTWEIKPWTLR